MDEADDVEAAAGCLEQKGCHHQDEIEDLPPDFAGFWISNPANIIQISYIW